jgi:hypothetical protein
MASVQVSRECLAGVLRAVHEAEGDPERQEDDERHGQPEGHPGAEGDGLLLGVVGGPHPDQDDVDAGAGQRRHPSDGRRVHHAEHHRLGEPAHLLLLAPGRPGAVSAPREPLQDPRRHRHHHDRARRVVDPHAEEEGGAGDAQQQQRRPHRVPAEQRRDLRAGNVSVMQSRINLSRTEMAAARKGRGRAAAAARTLRARRRWIW